MKICFVEFGTVTFVGKTVAVFVLLEIACLQFCGVLEYLNCWVTIIMVGDSSVLV